MEQTTMNISVLSKRLRDAGLSDRIELDEEMPAVRTAVIKESRANLGSDPLEMVVDDIVIWGNVRPETWLEIENAVRESLEKAKK